MTRPLRAAVIGAGAISLEHLRFLDASERATLVAVCDLSPVSAKIAARRFHADDHFTDAAAMIEMVSPDVVHVLTPPHAHAPMVAAALRGGAHVICEKPMASSVAETEKLLLDAAAAERHLIENHNYRFNDELRAVHDVLDSGRIGAVREVDIRLALRIRDEGSRFADTNLPSPIHDMPAGVLHDFITHLSYLMLDLAGVHRFDRVASAVSNHGGVDDDLFRFDDLDSLLISHPDDGTDGIPVHGRIRFSCRTNPDRFSITVRGDAGSVSTDIFHPFLEVVAERPGGAQLTPIVNHLVNGVSLTKAGLRNFGQKLLQHSPYHGLERFLDETYAALASGATPPVTPDNILDAAKLVDTLLAENVLTENVLTENVLAREVQS